MHAIVGGTADQVWSEALELFRRGGVARRQLSRAGDTDELLHVALEIRDPRQRWVASRLPAMNPAFAIVEAFWIVSGRRDAAMPLFWNPMLKRFAGSGPEYHGAYGHRIRHHFGVDQLDRVYHVLASKPDSRQAVIQIWDADSDLPDEDGDPASQDIPCNVMSLPKVRSNRLEWMQVMRSNDLVRGVPHNFVQFTIVQEMLAGWLGAGVGSYVHWSDSLHVYLSDMEGLRVGTPHEGVVNLAASEDSFCLGRPEWEEVMSTVMSRLDGMMRPRINQTALRSLILRADAPEAYENAVRVAGADAARRRGWLNLVEESINGVTNPALATMWDRWSARMS